MLRGGHRLRRRHNGAWVRGGHLLLRRRSHYGAWISDAERRMQKPGGRGIFGAYVRQCGKEFFGDVC